MIQGYRFKIADSRLELERHQIEIGFERLVEVRVMTSFG